MQRLSGIKEFLLFRRSLLLLVLIAATAAVLVWNARADDVQYIYDSLNRLIEVRYPDKVIRYTYDAAGNRTSEQVLSINPIPTLAGLSPSNKIVGGAAFTLTVNGANFVSGATVKWNGADRPTTFVDSATLTASITAADIAAAGMANVTVVNPDPTNGASSPLSFAINNPTPTITGTSPSSVQSGGATTILTVNGANFVSGAVARWNGANRATSVLSATQLTMVIADTDLASPGTASITVANPTPGGGTSTATTFTISPCSGSLSPASLSFNMSAATGSISVITATGACAWTATSNASWITVTSGSSGVGNGVVGYSIAANPGLARTGTMTIAGNTFTAAQASGCVSFTMNPANLVAGAVGTPYQLTPLSPTGGVAPHTFSVTAGALPPGLMVSTGGVLSGTPTASGNFIFTVRATDTNGCFGERVYALQICPIITISPNTLTPGTAGTPYPTTQLMASGGVAPYAFTIESGALPTGVMMDGAGLITGTPTVFGTFNFTVRATDSTTSCFGEQAYSLVINSPCGAITVNPASMPNGFVSIAYPTQTLSASGGTGPYSFMVSAGSLPNGLNLVGTSISGTPTLAGIYNFTIKATDANGCMDTRTYTVVISGSGPNSLMFYPLPAPVRLLDTRSGEPACFTPGAPINGGTSLTQLARGTCGIPASARAVTGNVTVVAPPAGGYLTIYPSDATQPLVANTNYAAGEILNNVFTVGLGAGDGSLKIFAFTTSHVVMDITGYYAPPGAGGLYFHPLPSPIRLLETRPSEPGCFTPGAPIAGNTEFTQQGTGTCNGVTIPASALALVGNATTVNPVGGGYLTFFPANAARPLIASGNYDAGEILNSPFTVGLSPTGQFKIYALTTTDLVVDVLGYYSPDAVDANGTGLLFNSLTPTRLLDTRPSESGCFTPGNPLNGGSETSQAARGACTIAASAQAIVGNATVVLPASGGYLTFWPSNATRPLVATSNYDAGSIFNRYFTVGLGTDGAFKMFAFTTTHVVVDVSGYFAP